MGLPPSLRFGFPHREFQRIARLEIDFGDFVPPPRDLRVSPRVALALRELGVLDDLRGGPGLAGGGWFLGLRLGRRRLGDGRRDLRVDLGKGLSDDLVGDNAFLDDQDDLIVVALWGGRGGAKSAVHGARVVAMVMAVAVVLAPGARASPFVISLAYLPWFGLEKLLDDLPRLEFRVGERGSERSMLRAVKPKPFVVFTEVDRQ